MGSIEVCQVQYNLKIQENDFLKQTLNTTQSELARLRGSMGAGNANQGQINSL
jgi:hypothetical protein